MKNKAKINLLFKILNNGVNVVYEDVEIINDTFINFFYSTMRELKPEDLHEIIYYFYVNTLYNQTNIDGLLESLSDSDIIDYDIASEIEESEEITDEN